MRGKKAVKNITTTLILQIVSIICGFILPRIIITTFGSSMNGLLASITQFLAFISLLDGGIGLVVKAALYKPLAKNDTQRIERILRSSQSFLNKIIAVFIIYIAALCIFYPKLLSSEFPAETTLPLIIIISLSTIIEYAVGLIYRLYLQARQDTHVTSLIQIGTILLNTIVSVILIKAGFGIDAVKIGTVVIYLIRAIVQCAYVRKRYGIKIYRQKDMHVLHNRWAGLLQHTATVIHENTDIVLLTIFSTTSEISVYTTYMLVITGIKGVVQALSSGIDSTFGDMHARGEKEAMNRSLRIYEQFYYTVITIMFTCTAVLVSSFVDIYTSGVTDVNYDRPIFGYIMVLSMFFWAVRQPYSAIVFSAGKFKETNAGSIWEAVINLAISLALVVPFGLVGVAIGTLVSTCIRSINYSNYASKEILRRSSFITIKRVLIAFCEIVFCFTLLNVLPSTIKNPSTYQGWLLYATLAFVVVAVFTVVPNHLLFKKDAAALFEKIKLLHRGRKITS